VNAGGPEVICVSGAVVSTVKDTCRCLVGENFVTNEQVGAAEQGIACAFAAIDIAGYAGAAFTGGASPAAEIALRTAHKGGLEVAGRGIAKEALEAVLTNLLTNAITAFTEVEEARLEVQELSGMQKGSLAVGAPPSVGTHLLPRALAAFSRQHPGIALAFREAGSRTLLTLLEEGELDLAVVIQPIRHPALETLPLLEEELLLAVPRQHDLAGGSSRVPLVQLRDEPFVMLREGAYDLREQTLAACRRAGFEPYVALDGGEMDSMLRFVGAGIGLAILPEMVLSELDSFAGPVALRRIEPKLSRSLVLARRRDRYFSAAAREFFGVLEATARLPNGSLDDAG